MAAWVIWLIVAGILVIAEMLTLTLYLLWFGIGAAAGAVAAYVAPEALSLQIAAMSVTALLLTLYSKRLSRRVRTGREYRDAVDRVVGKEGIVLQEITRGANGIVKVGGDTWSATAEENIASGETVRVLERSSTILRVKREGKQR